MDFCQVSQFAVDEVFLHGGIQGSGQVVDWRVPEVVQGSCCGVIGAGELKALCAYYKVSQLFDEPVSQGRGVEQLLDCLDGPISLVRGQHCGRFA